MQNPLLFETTKTSSILTHQIPSTLNPISSIRFDYRTPSSVILFLQHKAHVPIHLCKWLTESISLSFGYPNEFLLLKDWLTPICCSPRALDCCPGAKVNDKITLHKVLLVGTNTSTYIGKPIVTNVVVYAIAEEQVQSLTRNIQLILESLRSSTIVEV